jgi:hypothetical protein
MMENKSRKTKTRICGGGGGMWVQGGSKGMAESVVVVVVIAKSVVAVVIAESVVAVVMTVTRTGNSKGLGPKTSTGHGDVD